MRQNPKIICCLIAAALIFGGVLQGCASGTAAEETAPTAVETLPPVTEPAFITEDMPTIEETVLYDQDGLVVTALEFGKLGDDCAISVRFRNDSAQSAGVTTRSLSVNGSMMTVSGMECILDTGYEDEAYLILDGEELAQAGIDTVTNVEFYLQFFALGNDELAVSDMISLETSAAKDPTRSLDDSGIEVYNENGVRIVYRGFEVDEYEDGYANFYLENSTDRSISFTCEDAKVNGVPRDSSLWTDVRPGASAIDGVYFYDIGEEGIAGDADISTLGMTFCLFDSETTELYAVTPEIFLEFPAE